MRAPVSMAAFTGQVEALQQLHDGFVGPTLEHGEGLPAVVGDGGADDRLHRSEHDLATVVEERINVCQGLRVARHVACCRGISRPGATYHCIRVSMRLIGCVAMRSST